MRLARVHRIPLECAEAVHNAAAALAAARRSSTRLCFALLGGILHWRQSLDNSFANEWPGPQESNPRIRHQAGIEPTARRRSHQGPVICGVWANLLGAFPFFYFSPYAESKIMPALRAPPAGGSPCQFRGNRIKITAPKIMPAARASAGERFRACYPPRKDRTPRSSGRPRWCIERRKAHR